LDRISPEEISFLDRLLSNNWLGESLHTMINAGLQGFLKNKCAHCTNLGATRALLALKAYKKEKGALPDSLEALVPEYLEAIPLDDLDGKPLRYDSEKKELYSVGPDLQDRGMTYQIDF